MGSELFSAGMDVVSAAMTLAYIGVLLFGGPNSVIEHSSGRVVAKRSLRGQQIIPRLR